MKEKSFQVICKCLRHGELFNIKNDECKECKKERDEWIKSLIEEGWTKEDFIKGGWKNFEHCFDN